MESKEAIEIYKSMSQPPKEVLKEIKAGDLKGKSDINPQWRYEIMTKTFGLVGIGWKFEIQRLWTEQGANDEILAFAQVAVYIRDGDKWSDAITGIGGSKLVNNFSTGKKSNDEGFKMAVTDAFSTSLKMLGVAADVYAGKWDGSKYSNETSQKEDQKPVQKSEFAGGADTKEQRDEINKLISVTHNDGHPVFSKKEIANLTNLRKSKTAQQVIEMLKNDLKERLDQDEFPEDLPF